METARKQQLDELCRRFRPALLAYFLRRVASPAAAEDLAHDVFLRLAGVPLEQLRSADAFIFHVAANLLRDRARRGKVRADYTASQLAAVDAEEPETQAFDPERSFRSVRGRFSSSIASPVSLPVAAPRELASRRKRGFSNRYQIDSLAGGAFDQFWQLQLEP